MSSIIIQDNLKYIEYIVKLFTSKPSSIVVMCFYYYREVNRSKFALDSFYIFKQLKTSFEKINVL
jgi:hypothetical protein